MGEINPPILDDLSVSVEDLEAAVTYIERLQQYVDDVIVNEMERINMRMTGDSESRSVVPNATPFGAFEDARIQWKSLASSTANMQGSLTQLSQKLASLREGTEEIAETYRDAEERNRANASEIERILESAAAPAPPTQFDPINSPYQSY
ncbi:MAG TPA: hypothetical protein VFX61_22675 [Micromonosporaceae bacterium]|nr:hypothetical protein [Micromonosporaceae bacterium]